MQDGVSSPQASVRPVLHNAAGRSRLDPELLVASRARGYLQTLANGGLLVLVFMLARSASSLWQCLALYVASGFALHRLFFPLHDCIHYSLFPKRAENRFWGACLSGLLGTSFDAVRDQHLGHHRDFGTPQDPGAADYFPRFRSRRQLVAFLTKALVGGVLISKLGDYVLRPSRGATLRQARARRASVSGYGTILLIQGGVCAVLTHGFQIHQLWRYVAFNVLPAVTIFLFLVRLRMLLEHGALDYQVCNYAEGKRPTARTIYGSLLERILLCSNAFDYHHEHHLYPIVPGWQLPRLHQKLLAAGLDPEDIRQSYAQALAELWRYLAPARH